MIENLGYDSSKGLSLVVEKHGSHDQKTHGNWATGGTLYTGIIDRLGAKDVTGFSLDISSKKAPTSGYMASIAGAEKTVGYDEFFSSRDKSREILLDYISKNANQLSERGAYFGIWVVKDQGTVYLDVSRRFDTRGEGVRAGFENDQLSIYDIDNDAYIYMKDEVDERTNKAVADRDSNSSQRDDGRAEESIRGGDSQRDREQPLTFPHVCLGRYTVQKHLEGQHDQGTHGNWAGDRYPADSVKSARDGAKEYAFQKGLKPDETIDYTKVVANRDRASKIADIYETLPKMDRDAVDEYEALASEVEEQFDYMTKKLGVKVSFVAEDPYKTSKEMFADVSTGNLKVLSTASTGAHPLFSDLQNDKFRAVHDYFGHAATGRGFGQDGEESAWVHHSQMFTKKARAALTTETRGQNSFFNNRGKQFADQKVALLPEEFWAVPAVFTKIKVIRFEAGLKPIFKHSGGEAHGGSDDQSSHGNWATGGYTAEQQAGMAAMEGKGPSMQDLDTLHEALIMNEIGPSLDDMISIVENDQGLYEQAIDGIDEIVDEKMAQSKYEYADQAEADAANEALRNRLYEQTQTQMINDFVSNESDLIHTLYEEQNGGSVQSQLEEMSSYMDEVYSYEMSGKDVYGNDVTLYSQVTNMEPSSYVNGGIKIYGVVQTTSGEAAGEFERTMYKQGDTWMVEHDLYQMYDDYKGTGFGTKFIQQQEDWYTTRGFGAIVVGTAWDGARHWARAGFDWHPEYVEDNISRIANESQYNSNFEAGSENRKEFNSLMSRAFDGYNPDVNWSSQRINGTVKMKPITSDGFPLPNDFATIGIARKTRDSDGVSDWGGKSLMDGLNLKYTKVLTAEGRTVLQGAIDRDGDGLIYDGTAREKPAPTLNSTP